MVKIGFANSNNISLISEFEFNYFHDTAYSFDTLNEMLTDNYILKNNENIFIAFDDETNELYGYMIFHISDDFTDIYKIFVREQNRKNGIGKMLLDEISKLAKRYKSKKLMVETRETNENAIKFYESTGFKLISKRPNYYKNPECDALIYECILED